MINREEFQGDVLLTDDLDGGIISIENGLIMPDRGFSTAMYLSIFGGNSDDSGKVDTSSTWWGNRMRGTRANERMISKFQALIKVLPLTSKNLVLAQEAVASDVDWMKQEGIADEINVDVSAVDNHRVSITVIIKKNGELIEKGNYTANWEAVADGV